MSEDQTPPPRSEDEARSQRIAADVVKKFLSSKYKEGKEDELKQLINKRNAIRDQVKTLLKPIIDAAVIRPSFDPMYAHSETGRATLLIQANSFYIERLRLLGKDELLFLLSLMYAERTLEDLI